MIELVEIVKQKYIKFDLKIIFQRLLRQSEFLSRIRVLSLVTRGDLQVPTLCAAFWIAFWFLAHSRICLRAICAFGAGGFAREGGALAVPQAGTLVLVLWCSTRALRGMIVATMSLVIAEAQRPLAKIRAGLGHSIYIEVLQAKFAQSIFLNKHQQRKSENGDWVCWAHGSFLG